MNWNKSAQFLSIRHVFLLWIVLGWVLGCSDNSGIASDGDTESELSDVEEEIEETEEEVRERPEKGSKDYPKTLWRDEVETGHTFTWGFLPREHFTRNVKTNFPMVWDEENQRILAVDPGIYNLLQPEHDYVLYSLTEEKSEIVDYIDLPDIDLSMWEWTVDPAEIYSMVLIEDKLIFSFRKSAYYNYNSDYNLIGLLSYDLSSKNVRYVYAYADTWDKLNILGMIRQDSSEALFLRTITGFAIFDLVEEKFTPVKTECNSDQDYLLSCQEYPFETNYIPPIMVPFKGRDGLALYGGRLASLERKSNDDIIITSLYANIDHSCKNWLLYEECEESELPFSRDCCMYSRNLWQYKDSTYVLSYQQETFYKIDLENRVYERISGKSGRITQYGLSPDGTPASEAILGTPQDWLITPDGDLMWFSPWDFSVRGIAGPLDEWAE